MIKKILLVLTAFALSVLMLCGCTADESADMTDGDVTTRNTTASTSEPTVTTPVTTTDGVADWTGSDTTDISDVTGTETPTGGLDGEDDVNGVQSGDEDPDAGRDALNGDNTNGNGLSDGM
ncbi:MAG: hypothetical protein LUH23_09120 [Oscillospiraceae bacterium]|nr:hypothetical protein [Oscillospiraceae bacterium]